MPVSSRLLQPVSMIVLTGGPCSGKSSSLAFLTEKLSDHGFMVFVVPETATLITGNGIDRRKMDKPGQIVVFEEAIFDMQMSFEDTYKQAVSRIFPERRKSYSLTGASWTSGPSHRRHLQRHPEEEGLTRAAIPPSLRRGHPSRHGGGRRRRLLHGGEQHGPPRDSRRGAAHRPEDQGELARSPPF